ncbi:aminotransferase class III-fold pyridoxal phosphate-dependent enzyme, partial [uncultured Muribaculum sp.]|uniref:aminotransferase class III-fold pyridoxal phosphate-dependent enzyme n=1 Tax=uncultured Muribaculum sp. TaxID=1918613 RepID=UPI00272B1A65
LLHRAVAHAAPAIAVLEVFENENLVDNSAKVGQYLLDCLKEIPGIKEVRGRGLMIGIEMDYPVKDLRKHLIEVEHVFTGAASTNIIRLLPPLCLTKAEADEFIVRFKRALAANGKL